MTSKHNKRHKEYFEGIDYIANMHGYGTSIVCDCGRIMQPPKNMGYFYLAKARDGIYKFGKTNNLGRRLSNHKRTYPDFEYIYTWYIDNYDIFERLLKGEVRNANDDRHTFSYSAYLIGKGLVSPKHHNLPEYFILEDSTIKEVAENIEAEMRGIMTKYRDDYTYSTYVYWTKKTEPYFDPKDHEDKYDPVIYKVMMGEITLKEMKQEQKKSDRETKWFLQQLYLNKSNGDENAKA